MIDPNSASQSADAPNSQLTTRNLALGLFVLSMVAYGRAIFAGFDTFDTGSILLGQPKLFGAGGFFASLHNIFTSLPREEPLLVRDLSYLIDASIFGLRNPLGFHLTNVLLNAACTSLAFLIGAQISGRVGLTAIVTALWALLPVRVEAVAWIMGRKDLLSALFFLCAFWTLLSAPTNKPISWLRSLGIAALLGLASLSKISAIVGFVLLGLFDVSRTSSTRAPRLLRLLPAAIVSVGCYIWYSKVLASFGGNLGGATQIRGWNHFAEMARLGPFVLALYFKLIFVPWNYSVLYTWPNVNQALPVHLQLIGILTVVACALAGLWLFRRNRLALSFFLGFFILMVPYSGLTYVGFWLANRYVYLSSFFLLMSLALALEPVLKTTKSTVLKPACALLSLMLFLATASNVEHWMTPSSLWEHEVSLPRPSTMSFVSLAGEGVVRASKEMDEAKREEILKNVCDVVERGVQAHQTREWIPTPYWSRDENDLANLLVWRARVEILRKSATSEQLTWLEKAYGIKKTVATGMNLADVHLAVATATSGPAREEHLRKSLHYYWEVVSTTPNDPEKRARARAKLAATYGGFPSVADAVQRIDQFLAPK